MDGERYSRQLANGELMQLQGARGTELKATKGTLWVTLERDLRDIVVLPGDSFTIDRGGLTLVEAQGATKVCVNEHREHWTGRLTAWLRRAIEAVSRGRRSVPYY